MEAEIREALGAVRGASRQFKALGAAEDALNKAVGIIASISQYEKTRDELAASVDGLKQEEVNLADLIQSQQKMLSGLEAEYQEQAATQSAKMSAELEVANTAFQAFKDAAEREHNANAEQHKNAIAKLRQDHDAVAVNIATLTDQRDHLREALEKASQTDVTGG